MTAAGLMVVPDGASLGEKFCAWGSSKGNCTRQRMSGISGMSDISGTSGISGRDADIILCVRGVCAKLSTSNSLHYLVQ
jgi:hypothetical protein